MRYSTVLFDVDGTILDFDANETASLHRLFASRGVELTPARLQRYKEVNHGLWGLYERGEITAERLLNTRFATVLAEFGYRVEGADWEREYREYLAEGSQQIPHALEVCQELAGAGIRLYIATNGVRRTQLRRLEGAGLLPLFGAVFDSESIGVQKPEPGFFRYLAEQIPGYCSRETLLVGDSLASDILGGNRAQIDTCWINPAGKPREGQAVPTYEIRDLRELLKYCL